MSEKRDRFFSDTRSCTAFGVTVRPVRAVDGLFSRPHSGGENAPGAKKNGRHDEPVAVHNHQHFGIRRASARRWKKRWSDRGLQVLDLKAAGALSCSSIIEAMQTGSHSIILASPCMHHAPSRGRRQASVGRRQTDMNPSNPTVATLADVARHYSR